MLRDFNILLPDEPFKTTTELNKAVACHYTGRRWVIIAVDKNTKQVVHVEGKYDKYDDIDWERHEDPDWEIAAIDASKHLFEMAYLTHDYTTEEVEDYTETLPTGETWDYPYEKDAIVDVTFKHLDMTYNSATDEFSTPGYLEPAISDRTELTQFFPDRIAEADEVLDDSDNYSAEYVKKVQDFKDFHVNFDDTWGDVDHWKIPFPSFPVED